MTSSGKFILTVLDQLLSVHRIAMLPSVNYVESHESSH